MLRQLQLSASLQCMRQAAPAECIPAVHPCSACGCMQLSASLQCMRQAAPAECIPAVHVVLQLSASLQCMRQAGAQAGASVAGGRPVSELLAGALLAVVA